MKHTVPHDLGKELAKKAALAAFQSLSERFAKYSPRANWRTEDVVDVSFSAKGITLNGSLEVRDRSIEMDLDIPFLLRPFKDRALGSVGREIGRWIDRAKRGEL